jgi:hypothetical protein
MRVALCFLLLVQLATIFALPNDSVLLTDIQVRSPLLSLTVQALTFNAGSMTTARRGSAIPQLNCVGGSAQSSKFLPSVVQCRNVGHDGYNVEWACTADLDESVRCA